MSRVMTGAILVAATMASSVLDSPKLDVQTKWIVFKEKFNKNYGAEDATRFKVFYSNELKIQAHNAKGLGYTMGHNEFSDLTRAEFNSARVSSPMPVDNRPKNYGDFTGAVIADAVDWVSAGAVTPIKDQGQCGSCWAFSTTGSVEGAYQVATGSLLSLSEEDLVSCDVNGSDQGCNGGLMDNAFDYIQSDGICLEADYPYTAGGGNAASCSDSCTKTVSLTGYVDVKSEDDLKAALNIGPVSVAVEADKSAWQSYSGGVLDDSSCGTQLDHGVLAVGYGVDNGVAYWKVKNSWGSSWGEDGYIRLKQGQNQCGIASQPSYPTGVFKMKSPAPTPPTMAPPPSPASTCASLMKDTCGSAQSDPVDCLVCCYENADVDAACSEEEEDAFCGLTTKKLMA